MSAPGNSESLYEVRKLAGLCVRCGQPAAEDAQLCRKHQAKTRRQQRQSVSRRRQERRAQGRCAFCSNKSKTYRCVSCMAVWKAGQASVDSSVERYDDKLDRIRARTAVEADGRTRYRGQTRRGRQSIDALDAKDRELVRSYVAKYEAAIDHARRPEAADVPRIQRQEAEAVAHGYLRLAGGFINEILVRNGELPLTHVADDDEDDEQGDE